MFMLEALLLEKYTLDTILRWRTNFETSNFNNLFAFFLRIKAYYDNWHENVCQITHANKQYFQNSNIKLKKLK